MSIMACMSTTLRGWRAQKKGQKDERKVGLMAVPGAEYFSVRMILKHCEWAGYGIKQFHHLEVTGNLLNNNGKVFSRLLPYFPGARHSSWVCILDLACYSVFLISLQMQMSFVSKIHKLILSNSGHQAKVWVFLQMDLNLKQKNFILCTVTGTLYCQCLNRT